MLWKRRWLLVVPVGFYDMFAARPGAVFERLPPGAFLSGCFLCGCFFYSLRFFFDSQAVFSASRHFFSDSRVFPASRPGFFRSRCPRGFFSVLARFAPFSAQDFWGSALAFARVPVWCGFLGAFARVPCHLRVARAFWVHALVLLFCFLGTFACVPFRVRDVWFSWRACSLARARWLASARGARVCECSCVCSVSFACGSQIDSFGLPLHAARGFLSTVACVPFHLRAARGFQVDSSTAPGFLRVFPCRVRCGTRFSRCICARGAKVLPTFQI